jgi:NADPH-dependent 7-cyano-7-deazaguanine reductase QueF
MNTIKTAPNVEVAITYPAFTCLCPINGLTDTAEVTVRYTTRTKTVELASFREGLEGYAETSITHEDFTAALAGYMAALLGTFVSVSAMWAPVEGIVAVTRTDAP